ncbi:MAG: MFS transporter, partial [Nanoarchaeota archaeon]
MTKLWSKEVLSYAFYDFANSSYALLILTFTYGLYFKSVVLQDALNADLMWGIATAVPVFIAALLSPFLGALADHIQHKKLFLVISTLVTVILTVLLATVDEGEVAYGMTLIILASTFYYFSTLFYDAFIVDVADNHSVGKVSGFSWGLGYLGGVAALLVVAPFVNKGLTPDNLSRYQFSFVLVALFFLLFALPFFLFVKQKIFPKNGDTLRIHVRHSFRDMVNIWRERRSHKHFLLLILAFFFYNDALSTLFAFAAIFAQFTIGMTIGEINVALLVMQLIAFPAAWFFGTLSDILGHKPLILTTLSMILVFSGVAAFAESKYLFVAALWLAALGIGAAQSCTRALIRTMIPEDRSAHFFGFQSFLGKFSAFLGPLIFGYLSSAYQNQRI